MGDSILDFLVYVIGAIFLIGFAFIVGISLYKIVNEELLGNKPKNDKPGKPRVFEDFFN